MVGDAGGVSYQSDIFDRDNRTVEGRPEREEVAVSSEGGHVWDHTALWLDPSGEVFPRPPLLKRARLPSSRPIGDSLSSPEHQTLPGRQYPVMNPP